MRRTVSLLFGPLLLAGCATQMAPAPVPVAQTIRYETGPCFGACPVYALAVSANGQGVFTGKRFTEATGERRFLVTPGQYAAFAARLAPYRPRGERRYTPGSPLCPHAATDMPSVDVRWDGPQGGDHLYYYFGCNMDDRGIADALGQAPDVLGIEALIGARP